MTNSLRALVLAILILGLLAVPALADKPSRSGKGKIAFVSDRDGNYDIWVMNGDGSDARNLTADSPEFDGAQPTWSPDGTKIAFASRRAEGDLDLYVMRADGKGLRRVTRAAGDEYHPTWSPDGKKLAYAASDDDTLADIYTVRSSGGGKEQNVTRSPDADDTEPSWSPKSGRIVFGSDALEAGNNDIYDVRADGRGGLRRLTSDAGYDAGPDFTADGRWILFDSDREGQGEIYLMGLNGGREHRLTHDPRFDMLAASGPTGDRMAFSREGGDDGLLDIWVSAMDGSSRNLTDSAGADDMAPDWQPLQRSNDDD